MLVKIDNSCVTSSLKILKNGYLITDGRTRAHISTFTGGTGGVVKPTRLTPVTSWTPKSFLTKTLTIGLVTDLFQGALGITITG